jgi:hypothetical protein
MRDRGKQNPQSPTIEVKMSNGPLGLRLAVSQNDDMKGAVLGIYQSGVSAPIMNEQRRQTKYELGI